MKKYSTVFLSSALLLASLAPNATAFAQTTSTPTTTSEEVVTVPTLPSTSEQVLEEQSATTASPTEVKQTLTTQLNGQTLSIFYNRSEQEKNANIQFAVWSTEGDQDDLKWYTAGEQQTEIPLSNHSGYGTYIIHSYMVVQNRFVFLDEATFTLNKPEPTLSTSITEPGFLDISVRDLPTTTTEVKIPIWSDQNGQDDLVWYTADKVTDGSYKLRVPLSQHKYQAGTYYIHLYTRDIKNSGQTCLINSQFLVEPSHIPAIKQPTITITNLNQQKGTYTVSVKPQPNSRKIKEVSVATWSTSNQSNLKWRTAQLSNDSYQVPVNFQEHQGQTGFYHNHIYVTYDDGSRICYIAPSVDLSNAKLPVTFAYSLLYAGNMTATFANISDNSPIQVAVWSAENDQDDLAWYTVTKSTDRTYNFTIPLSKHKGIGTYHVHVYQNNAAIANFTMNITRNHRTVEANTYPIGQCTWGAKEAAPWVKNYWGNAGQWLVSARNAGFRTGTTPQVGAVAVWTNSYYGHVGVVTAVNGSQIKMVEANYAGKQWVGDFRGWFSPTAEGIAGYIYPN